MANLTQKGSKLIKENPDATPQQLLALGLSKGDYAKLIGENVEVEQTVQQPKKLEPTNFPTPTHSNVIRPILSQNINAGKNPRVRVVPVGGGIGSEMSRKIAEGFVARSKGRYKIREI